MASIWSIVGTSWLGGVGALDILYYFILRLLLMFLPLLAVFSLMMIDRIRMADVGDSCC